MCGVLGVITKQGNVIDDAIVLLNAQNHRGEQRAGMAVFDGKKIRFHNGPGKVAEVFGDRDRDIWSKLKGSVLAGHTLYSTVSGVNGKKQPRTQHPIPFGYCGQEGVISHNGNLVGLKGLRRKARKAGYRFISKTSDTEVIAALLSISKKPNFLEALLEVLKEIEGKGTFSLVILYGGKIYGVRDQNGNKPLCIIKKSGRDGGGDTYILASESSVYPSLDATRFVREVGMGELVVIGPRGIERSITWTEKIKSAFCLNEAVYFANPATRVLTTPANPSGVSVYAIRYKWGQVLARKHPVKGAQVTAAIPDSGLAYGDGYAAESGVHSKQGFIKSHYPMGQARTFTEPRDNAADRSQRQIRKLQANPDVMRGKIVGVPDDSIIRLNVARAAVKMAREHGGAKQVHLRIGSPRICHRCHLGIDIPTLNELVATRLTLDQTTTEVCADSLEHLTVEEARQGLLELGLNPDDFCWGCFTGKYPVDPPE